MAIDDDLRVNAELTVPAWELQEAFVRASGPGGQNVNKVSTAVQLRWNVDASSLPPAVKRRFKQLNKNQISTEGDFVLEAKEHRKQSHNREAARKRLKDLIAKAAKKPKRRISTRPTYGSVKRRLKAKKRRGEIKSLRGSVNPDE